MTIVLINLQELDESVRDLTFELGRDLPTPREIIVKTLNDIMEEHIDAILLGYQAMVDLGFFDEFDESDDIVKDFLIRVTNGIETCLTKMKILASIHDAKVLNIEGDVALNLEIIDGNC